jgi:DNA segregation ATPase FtsK/SpoIIIE-like protein
LPEKVDLDDFDDTEDSFGKKNRTLRDNAKRILHIMDTSDENGDSTSPSYETVASMLKIVDIGTSIDVDKFMEAINYAICGGSVSTSMIQRKMGIGFGQAIKFIDLMEEMGIISKRNGAMPREVLMTKKEWRDVLEKLKNE